MVLAMDSRLLERDRAEIKRSAEEARKTLLQPCEVDRYLNPPADSPYPLEYAFHLLGDVRGKTVLDLGCGTGENLLPLVKRGARVLGMDISPDLIALAERRLQDAGMQAELTVGSAYETGLPSASVDAIFCMSLIHHLDIALVCQEMRRILARDGFVVLKEPIRFSKTYAWLRDLLPSHGDVSDYEHPLTSAELAIVTERFRAAGTRYFRLPFVPLASQLLPIPAHHIAWKTSDWLLQHSIHVQTYATVVAMKLHQR
jgi:SAM-dependent methyltransferase